jgi:hypothetical protein
MSGREIQGHLQEIYGIDVSPDLISTITDAVLDEVSELARPRRLGRLREKKKTWTVTVQSVELESACQNRFSRQC